MPHITLEGQNTSLDAICADNDSVSFTAGCSKVSVSRSTLADLANLPNTKPPMQRGWYRIPITNYLPGKNKWTDKGAHFLGDVNIIYTTKATDAWPGCVRADIPLGQTSPRGDSYGVYFSTHVSKYPDKMVIVYLAPEDFA